jgi:hypothetical protein
MFRILESAEDAVNKKGTSQTQMREELKLILRVEPAIRRIFGCAKSN